VTRTFRQFGKSLLVRVFPDKSLKIPDGLIGLSQLPLAIGEVVECGCLDRSLLGRKSHRLFKGGDGFGQIMGDLFRDRPTLEGFSDRVRREFRGDQCHRNPDEVEWMMEMYSHDG